MSETSSTHEWYADDGFWTAFRPLAFGSKRWNQASADVDSLLRQLNIACAAPAILDLCCGPGRYALELARRGIDVTAVDLSDVYLAELTERHRTGSYEGVVEIIKSDMRIFKRTEAFDGAICVGLSFGYLARREEDVQVLQNVHESLRPGAQFILEVPTPVWPDELGAWYVVGSGDEGALVEQTVSLYDPTVQSLLHIKHGGKVSTFKFSQRLYTSAEVVADLDVAGFDNVRLFGSYDGAPLASTSRKIIAIAQKRSNQLTARL